MAAKLLKAQLKKFAHILGHTQTVSHLNFVDLRGHFQGQI